VRRIARDLVSAIPLRERELIAIVGGGGKTNLLFALAEELRSRGRRVITSTTTKVRYEEALRAPSSVALDSEPRWLERVREGLLESGHLFVSRKPLDSGKVEGIDPVAAARIYEESLSDYLILEADGSAGRPVKAPAPHEPVIPSATTLTVAVMGLDALERPFSAETVFREELFERMTGIAPGENLTPQVLAKVFLDPEGLFKGTPPSAGRCVFLNKLDSLARREGSFTLAELLLSEAGGGISRVVIGSLFTKEYYVVE
jgi:probable selenium-dependent hydroxylase accessory protein YqeC